ncbi:MAG: hypothetical protein II178_07925 [Selenomonadaceae bacterium]|nr:hypothetical protein [Selenomonadaceae bacterium]MBQ1915134.1 hypothetical protein [Selenomonadaceae bacterium]
MARNVNIDEQIEVLDAKIEKASARIRDLKAKRQELLDRKEAMAMQEVYDILQERGMSASQAADILRNHNG